MLLVLLFACGFLAQIVSSTPTARPTPSPSSNTAIPTFLITLPSATCTDIAVCRTRYTIIWSSLVTILACVWTAVHRNVPAPEKGGESRVWRTMSRVLEAAKIVVVTVLVPEWVLAWAVRQLLNAREVRRELNWARGGRQQEIPDWVDPRLTYQIRREEAGSGTRLGQYSGAAWPTEAGHLGEKAEAARLALDMVNEVNEQTGRLRGEWSTRHGFSVIMGGFHYYARGEPQVPLSRRDVIWLVRRGDLVPPTDEEIRNWSQSDVVSKTLAVVQTIWFIIQAIARRIEGLPITQLEIMTLAYTTITVAMYVAWWDKPKNVGGPVRIAAKELPDPARAFYPVERCLRIFHIISGMRDDDINLRNERSVPTFYGGGIDGTNSLYADILALLFAMVFGAVHCAAWNYAFPSHVEKLAWHVSSLAIVALPGVMLVFMVLLWTRRASEILEEVVPFMFALATPLYVAARLLLLALSFSTLRSLPSEAYRAVQWTLLIPHFT
ncbi:hypothetical protein BV25DRAFT_1918234 [Artomyces pyxidatus]|uniref:Uncharacterized protein n=1 Tax=Artomyces pyxidatus TaxID=48021 RepID=A0ACB8SVD7_9AGAM|nr:hypothetical protein BV25DRAFT_1918234 [Artomyces pyxidatus]